MVGQDGVAIGEASSRVIDGLLDRLPALDRAKLNACFIDTLADGPEELTEALLAEFDRRGFEPGD